ncbi:MAG: hypothetical protein OXU81_00885 [Gammaproteobacteria bacterium]|nr:hypothetical protein [Gammaproteobacteria bacterium]
MGEDGDGAGLADGLHNSNGRLLRCTITLPGVAAVTDIPKQLVDIRGILVRVEQGKDVDVAVGGNFHSGEQVERPELVMLLLCQTRER